MKEPRNSVFASTVIACRVAVLAVVASAGCVITPYEGQEVSRYGFELQGYAQTFELVTVEAYSLCSQRWVDNATTVSAQNADFPAGYWNNSPELHPYAVTVLLNDSCYWGPGCDPRRYCAHIRVREGYQGSTVYHYRGGQSSLSCDIQQLGAGTDFYTAGFNCGFDNTVITLFPLS
jgi:hypothetical protein